VASERADSAGTDGANVEDVEDSDDFDYEPSQKRKYYEDMRQKNAASFKEKTGAGSEDMRQKKAASFKEKTGAGRPYFNIAC